MAVEEQYARALCELAVVKAKLEELEDAAFKLLEWDRDRNYIVPYRVRDPIIAILNKPATTDGVRGTQNTQQENTK